MAPVNIYKNQTPGEEPEIYLETATGSLLGNDGSKHSREDFDHLIPVAVTPSGYGVWNESDKRDRSYSGEGRLIWEEDYCTWLSSDRGYFGTLQAWKSSASKQDVETLEFAPEEFDFLDLHKNMHFVNEVADAILSGKVKILSTHGEGAEEVQDFERFRGLVLHFRQLVDTVKVVLPTGEVCFFDYTELKSVYDSVRSGYRKGKPGKSTRRSTPKESFRRSTPREFFRRSTPREFINQIFTLWSEGMLDVTTKNGYVGAYHKETIENSKTFFQEVRDCVQYQTVKNHVVFLSKHGSSFRVTLKEAREKTCYSNTAPSWTLTDEEDKLGARKRL